MIDIAREIEAIHRAVGTAPLGAGRDGPSASAAPMTRRSTTSGTR